MTTGWTGGQYSIFRALLAIAVFRVFFSRMAPFASGEWAASGEWSPLRVVLLGVVAVASAALAIGTRERLATSILIFLLGTIVALMDGAPLVLPGLDGILALFLLALHLGVLFSAGDLPFGAWDARERPDPAGKWEFPSWLTHVAWASLATLGLVAAIGRLTGTAFRPPEINAASWAWVALAFEAFAVLGFLRPAWRAPIWIALCLWHIAYRAAFGPALLPTHLWLFHILAFDPAWLPGKRRAAPDGETASEKGANPAPRLFYDGECGLCHRSVRILLAEEGRSADATALRFAPLGGEAFSTWIDGRREILVDELPDSIVLVCEEGQVLTRSSAAIDLASRLGGFWRALAVLGGLFPEAARDRLYDGIAAVRKSVFSKPKDACPILPPELRERFDL